MYSNSLNIFQLFLNTRMMEFPENGNLNLTCKVFPASMLGYYLKDYFMTSIYNYIAYIDYFLALDLLRFSQYILAIYSYQKFCSYIIFDIYDNFALYYSLIFQGRIYFFFSTTPILLAIHSMKLYGSDCKIGYWLINYSFSSFLLNLNKAKAGRFFIGTYLCKTQQSSELSNIP